MASTKKLFGFDAATLESLAELVDSGKFPSEAEAVRTAIQVARCLQSQLTQGYTEVVVRNPKRNRERVVCLPKLVVK